MVAGTFVITATLAKTTESDIGRIRTGVWPSREDRFHPAFLCGDCGVTRACERSSHRNVVKSAQCERAAPEGLRTLLIEPLPLTSPS
jgi:hypothetical protein